MRCEGAKMEKKFNGPRGKKKATVTSKDKHIENTVYSVLCGLYGNNVYLVECFMNIKGRKKSGSTSGAACLSVCGVYVVWSMLLQVLQQFFECYCCRVVIIVDV